MFISNKKILTCLLYANIFFGVCYLPSAWSDQAAVGSNAATHNEQIARDGPGNRGGVNSAGTNRNGAYNHHPANKQNLHQNARRDMYRHDLNRNNPNNLNGAGNVQPVVPAVIPVPAYNVNPYATPNTLPPA